MTNPYCGRKTLILVLVGFLAAAWLGGSAPAQARTVQERYDDTIAEISRLSQLLNQKNQEVVQRYGRNDTPEALEILTPIREDLAKARQRQSHLLCWDRDVPPRYFEKIGLAVKRGRLDHQHLDQYIAGKRAEGELSESAATDLRFILSKAGYGVMNPSSRGAGQINRRIAQALSCFGLDTPARVHPTVVHTPTPAPAPSLTPQSELHYYSTCGDHVCQDGGYRGPFDGVPPCVDEREGDPCSEEGRRCDQRNHCNIFLVCARTDPATRCAR